MKQTLSALLTRTAAATAIAAAPLADGAISDSQVVDDVQGGFAGALDDDDHFGTAIANLGDLDGDGVRDLAVGAPDDDDGGLSGSGAVWILFLNADGTVKSEAKISLDAGGFSATLPKRFGRSLARLGDVDGDGVTDLAVASEDYVHILFLAADGSVAGQTDLDWIGLYPLANADAVVAGLDDVDGDGTPDLAVRGVVSERLFLALLHPDGSTKSVTQYDPTFGTTGGGFGDALASVGDVDGDGVPDLAVGDADDTAGGAVWVLFLDSAGAVTGSHKTTADDLGYGGFGELGESLARLGDVDGSGAPDLLVGSNQGVGVLWTLFLDPDGSVRSWVDYQAADYGPTEFLDDFGTALASADVDGDGVNDLVVGAPDRDGGGVDRGGVHVLFYEGVSPGGVEAYPGCGLNPAGSLQVVGAPVPGATLGFELDNPLGTQNPGALAFLALSPAGSADGGGCGLPLPGLNLDPTKAFGELLVAPPLAAQISWTGSVWLGPGQPVTVPVELAGGVELLGVSFVAQGLLLDPGAGITGTQPVGLTRAGRVTIGS
ncbi:MAG: FG-GAP-like repeat-containing protein [Planctomycetota bacterium]